jgi:hypothetical protein
MTNLLQQAINCADPDQAAKLIQDALGIESDDVIKYCFPEGMADRPRAPREIHRRVAEDRGALSRLVTKSPPDYLPLGQSKQRTGYSRSARAHTGSDGPARAGPH